MPKFFASTSGGTCLIQSLSRKVLSSSKSPSSNTNRNSAPSGPRPWIECGMPGGKYHRSPTPTSSTKLRPCGSIAVMRARAVEHVGPLGGLVPMQLAHAAGIEPHVDAGDVLGNAELAHRHLPGPAARLQTHMGVVEREAQIRQRAVVGGRRREDVRVLAGTDRILRTRIGAAAAGTCRLRHRRSGLRLGRRRRRERAASRRNGQHVATRNRIRDRAHLPLLGRCRTGRRRAPQARNRRSLILGLCLPKVLNRNGRFNRF